MAARVFAVLAALLLVTATAIALLTPSGLTLAQGMLQVDAGWLDGVQARSPAWAWAWVEVPFLMRPLWLVPACLGLVFAGLAMSFSLGAASTTRRRRS